MVSSQIAPRIAVFCYAFIIRQNCNLAVAWHGMRSTQYFKNKGFLSFEQPLLVANFHLTFPLLPIFFLTWTCRSLDPLIFENGSWQIMVQEETGLALDFHPSKHATLKKQGKWLGSFDLRACTER